MRFTSPGSASTEPRLATGARSAGCALPTRTGPGGARLARRSRPRHRRRHPTRRTRLPDGPGRGPAVQLDKPRTGEIPMIEIDQLSKHYKQGKTVVRALDDVSFNIESGEFVAVVGRSGSGKTTMLDSLGLLLRPTSGRIVIDGTETSSLKADQKARLRTS